ncbi:MAG: Wzz/FepE/Etk N-terminal domain-containing protein [Bacteroidia bacterium]
MLNTNLSIIKKIFKAKKHIAIVVAIAMVVGLIYSFSAKPLYTSIAYVYPANIVAYGQESQTEQLLQFLESNEVRAYVVTKFKLLNHYHIDSTKENYLDIIDDIITAKIKITKTKYESVEIKVVDNNPDTAKMLVLGIIDGVNQLIENEHREKYNEDVLNSTVYLKYKTKEVDSTKKILEYMSQNYGLLNVGVQLKEAARNEYKSTNSSSTFLSKLMQDMNKYGIEQGELSIYFDDQVRSLAFANNDYQKHLSDYYRKNTFVVVASKPVKPTTPTWPKPWFVVILSGVTMLVISCLYFIFIDNIKIAYAKIIKE